MIALLIGTRPEIIKMAPVVRELVKRRIPFLLIHSNQHYSKEMDADIFNDLQLSEPDVHLGVGSGTHAEQTGKIMIALEGVFLQHKPDVLVVHGDTNTTLAGALTAKKLHIPVAHVEAGLRSHDYLMPEEVNRTLTDRISDILFAPTNAAKKNLVLEGISEKSIIVTGNTIVDALRQHKKLSTQSTFLHDHSLKEHEYVVVTLHREENTATRTDIEKMFALFTHAHMRMKVPFFWPLHPRTKSFIEKEDIILPDFIQTSPAVGYIDMIALLSNASLVLTDSGGLQEEAYLLHTPLMTLRTSTERPETLSANFIIGSDREKFDRAWDAYIQHTVGWDGGLGDGNAAVRIVDILEDSKGAYGI